MLALIYLQKRNLRQAPQGGGPEAGTLVGRLKQRLRRWGNLARPFCTLERATATTSGVEVVNGSGTSGH